MKITLLCQMVKKLKKLHFNSKKIDINIFTINNKTNMKIIIKSSNKLIKLLELFKIIKSLNVFCTLYCNKDRIFIQTMDDSHITLLNINIKKDWFETYECDVDEVLSFNSSIITNILNLYSPKTVVTFTTTEDLDFLDISLLYSDNSEKAFSLPLVDIDSDLLASNNIDCGIDLSISTKKFDKIISEHSLFGDSVDIVYNKNTFYMRTMGDLGEYKLKIPKDNLSIIENINDFQTYNKISLKYLSYITKLYSVFEKISIQIPSEEGGPLTVKYYEDNENRNNDLLEIIYYIAPKFQDDDEEINYSEFEY